MRTFLAIDVPDDLARHIARAQSRLTVGRHVPRENLHVTLAFLDDQPDIVLEELDRELTAVNFSRFSVQPKGFDQFGTSRLRSAYLAIEPSPSLLNLHQGVLKACRLAGISLPHRRYIPHITISRFSAVETPEARLGLVGLAEFWFDPPPFEVFGFSLYSSTLTPAGPRYDVLASYPLA